MKILDIKPRRGDGTYRIGDSDNLVVMEKIGFIPSGSVCLQNHGVIVFCTEGRAQFEYDGALIQLQKSDFFLYMVHSTVCNILTSPDFNCRQIWFERSELWNVDIYKQVSMANMTLLKLHPVVHLTNNDIKLCDNYFRLLCDRMKSMTVSASPLIPDIIRSLFGTLLLELLSIIRRNAEHQTEWEPQEDEAHSSLHKKRVIDHFLKLVENSDGRIRRVDKFASQLNITPKYLSSIIKEVMNRRPSTYILLYTMKAIERRLRFTDMTMQEIANDLNFPNASFFGKYFKEHTGMTPLEYRNKYHAGK